MILFPTSCFVYLFDLQLANIDSFSLPPGLLLAIYFQNVAFDQKLESIVYNRRLVSEPFSLFCRNLRVCEAKWWTMGKMTQSSAETFSRSINWVCFLSDKLRESKSLTIWAGGSTEQVSCHSQRKSGIKCTFVCEEEWPWPDIAFLWRSFVLFDYNLTLVNLREGLSLSKILLLSAILLMVHGPWQRF